MWRKCFKADSAYEAKARARSSRGCAGVAPAAVQADGPPWTGIAPSADLLVHDGGQASAAPDDEGADEMPGPEETGADDGGPAEPRPHEAVPPEPPEPGMRLQLGPRTRVDVLRGASGSLVLQSVERNSRCMCESCESDENAMFAFKQLRKLHDCLNFELSVWHLKRSW